MCLLETNPNTSSGFRHVSVGGTRVWAITNSGCICNRCGITSDNPAGTGWNYGISVSILITPKSLKIQDRSILLLSLFLFEQL